MIKKNRSDNHFSFERLDTGRLGLRGELDHDAVVQAREQGEQLLRENRGDCQISLEGLESAHSGVLSLLLCLIRYAERHQSRVTFTSMPDRLYDMARMSGLDHLLPLERQSS